MTELRLPFPIKGVDRNWGYHDQPRSTTPDCLNVRPYSSDEERARGGTRPALVPAYESSLGGAIQWLGWMDYGFGDTVGHADDFAYGDGALNDRTNTLWSGAASKLMVKDNRVRIDDEEDDTWYSSGGISGISGTFEDFELEASVQWNYGTTAEYKIWCSSAAESGNNGVLLTLKYQSTVLGFPMLGYQSQLSITAQSGSNTRVWQQSYGGLMAILGGTLIVKGTGSIVEVWWDTGVSRTQVISVTRQDGACSSAGFAMKRSQAEGDEDNPYPMYDMFVSNFDLTAIRRPSSSIGRQLIAISGGKVYADMSAASTTTVGSSALLSATHCNGKLFIVNGTKPMVYDPLQSGDKVYEWVARKGGIEKNCTLIANWRNRLVLSGSKTHPSALFMSKLDDPYNFDYAVDVADSATAAAGGELGRIGDPVVALAPIADDLLIVFCTRSIYVYRGDPASGGFCRLLTDKTGIVGANAWTTDDQGRIWFLGTSGLYVMGGGQPKCITNTRLPELGGENAVAPSASAASGDNYVALAFDPDNYGIAIIITPVSGDAVHYWYDLRLDGLWPESYPVGIRTAEYYNAHSKANRRLLLGGDDGALYKFDTSKSTDEKAPATESAIESFCWLEPRRYAGMTRSALINRLIGVLGSGSVKWALHSGDTPDLASSEAQAQGIWGSGRNESRPRVRGGALALKLQCIDDNDPEEVDPEEDDELEEGELEEGEPEILDKRWSLEAVSVEIQPVGR